LDGAPDGSSSVSTKVCVPPPVMVTCVGAVTGPPAGLIVGGRTYWLSHHWTRRRSQSLVQLTWLIHDGST
jgi:hypothetical protein